MVRVIKAVRRSLLKASKVAWEFSNGMRTLEHNLYKIQHKHFNK